MSYILSIIVPTKNRLQYLKECVETFNALKCSEVELIIQDNSDNHFEVESYINDFNNENIKYYYCGEKLSQTENSDLALSHSSGDYVTYIGDDDAICEKMICFANCMKEHNIDACTYGISVFNWPDLIEKVPTLPSFQIPRSCGEIAIQNSSEILLQALKNGLLDISKLPRVYHGIVSKELLNKVYLQTGSYFPGPSPDMANAVGCALASTKMISTDIPLIISGYGGSSAGGLGKRNLHKGSLKNNFQLRNDVEKNWPRSIPKLWMGCTMWPASGILSLQAMGRKDLIPSINYGKIYGETFLKDRSSLLAILKCRPNVRVILETFLYVNKRIINKIFSHSTSKYAQIINEPIFLSQATNIQNQINEQFDIEALFESIML